MTFWCTAEGGLTSPIGERNAYFSNKDALLGRQDLLFFFGEGGFDVTQNSLLPDHATGRDRAGSRAAVVL